MSKVYEVLSGLSPQLREEAREILDAMLASGDIVNWDRQHRLMLDNRSLPNTNIVDLVAHLLHPHDERVQALKDIKLESEWVQNELVKDILDDASDSSDSEDESDDGDDDDDDDDDNNEDYDNDGNDGDDGDGNDDDGDGNDDDEPGGERGTDISTQL